MNETVGNFWQRFDDLQTRVIMHKNAVLGELRKAGKNFDEVEAWKRIELLSLAAIAPEFASDMETPASVRRERFRDIAKASRRLRKLIGTEKITPDLYCELAANWWDSQSAEQPSVGEAEEKLTQSLKFIVALEQGASRAAANIPSKKGAQPKRICGVIIELANIYTQTTGKVAGTDAGPFERFVSEFLSAIDQEKEDVIDFIKNCMKQKSKKKSQKRKLKKAQSLG